MSAPIETRQQLQPQPLTIPADFGGLTLKQSSFCDHYLLTGNATDATIKAGYTQDRDSAAAIGCRLLRNVKVQAEIKRRLGLAIATPDEVLERLTVQARADLGEIFEPDGSFNWRKAKRRDKTRLLKKVKYDKKTGRLVELEIHDPQAALEKLGRFHKLFTDKVETELAASDVERLSDSIIAGLFEAAQRRVAQQDVVALPAANATDSGSD